MAVTRDFQEFIDNLNSRDIEQIHSLYLSIVDITEVGYFNCRANTSGRLFIKEQGNDPELMLENVKSKNAFLGKLDMDFGGGFGSVYGHCEFQRGMDKND